MLLVDDVLLAPMHGLLWIFGKIHEAAQEELAGEADAITAELSELYVMLESGRIPEADFAAREQVLLDRLDEIRGQGVDSSAEDPEDEEEDDDDDDGAEE